MYLKLIFSGLFTGMLILFPVQINAQLGVIPDSVSIELSPQYPEPNQEIKASLNAYSLDTTGATITWYLDEIEQPEAKNARSFTFLAGSKGGVLTLRVVANLKNGQTLNLTETIAPSRVDIIVEADTSVPNHYQGRPLPSAGSMMRIIAIPDTNLNPNELTYSWQVDNKPLYGGPIVGKNVATFETPKKPRVLVRVNVSDSSGRTVARKLTEIEIAEPEILFYENNPLRGLSNMTLRNPTLLISSEITVRGEPYYLDSTIFSNDPLIEWKLNNQTITNPSTDPREITLRRTANSGSVKAELHIRNLENLLQGSKADFTLNF